MEGMNNNNNVDNQEKVQDNSTRFFTEEQFVAYKKERRRLKSERGIHRQVYAAFVSLIVAVTPVFYFFYYTGIFFLSLLAFRRIGGLLDRFTNFNSLFTNLFFWGGVLLYMGVLSIFCIIIIRKTLKDFEEDFTEEFFKNKALEAIAIQKNSVIYRYVSYIFYIIEGQDFAVNNIRFGRLYLGYYMVLFLFKKFGYKKAVELIKIFILNRDYYEFTRINFIKDLEDKQKEVLRSIILEAFNELKEKDPITGLLDILDRYTYWRAVYYRYEHEGKLLLEEPFMLNTDLDTMENFLWGYTEERYVLDVEKGKYGLVNTQDDYSKNYLSSGPIYLSLLILWFIPEIKYLKMKDKNIFEIYYERFFSINNKVTNFLINYAVYVPNSNMLLEVQPQFTFKAKQGVTRTAHRVWTNGIWSLVEDRFWIRMTDRQRLIANDDRLFLEKYHKDDWFYQRENFAYIYHKHNRRHKYKEEIGSRRVIWRFLGWEDDYNFHWWYPVNGRKIVKDFRVGRLSSNWHTRNLYTNNDKKLISADWSYTDRSNATINGIKTSPAYHFIKAHYSNVLMHAWMEDDPTEDLYMHFNTISESREYLDNIPFAWYSHFEYGKKFSRFQVDILSYIQHEIEKGLDRIYVRLELDNYRREESLVAPYYLDVIMTPHSFDFARYLDRTKVMRVPELVWHDFITFIEDDKGIAEYYHYRHGFNTYDANDTDCIIIDDFTEFRDPYLDIFYTVYYGPKNSSEPPLTFPGEVGHVGNIRLSFILLKLLFGIGISSILLNYRIYKNLLLNYDIFIIFFVVFFGTIAHYIISSKALIFFIIVQILEPIFGDIGFIALLDLVLSYCEVSDQVFLY